MSIETSYLWVVTIKSIFAISVEKLLQLGNNGSTINWSTLTTPPSDFHLDDLPEEDLRPILYDSKVFLACGQNPNDIPNISDNIYQLSFQENSHNPLLVYKASPNSIPPLPLKSFWRPPRFLNVEGKIYLLHYVEDETGPAPEAFWVLDPKFGQWRSLESRPPIFPKPFDFNRAYTHNGKVFLQATTDYGGQILLYCFDNQTEKWAHVKSSEFRKAPMIYPISLPGPRPDQMVALGLRWSRLGLPGVKIIEVRAILLDSNDHSVLCIQTFDEVYKGIECPPLEWYNQHAELVDLGNGKVCALISGIPYYPRIEVLWVLVFSLSLSAQPGPDKFLDVKLDVNRLYVLPNHSRPEEVKHAFIHDHPRAFSKGSTSPPRKQQKLASGTSMV